MYLSEDDDDWPDHARIVLNIHDALIAVCRLEDRYLVAKIMRKHAEEPIWINGEPLIVPADVAFSQPTAWRTYEKDEKHVIEYFDDKATGRHRWAGLKKIKREELDAA